MRIFKEIIVNIQKDIRVIKIIINIQKDIRVIKGIDKNRNFKTENRKVKR